STINTNFNELPVPVMRFLNGEGVYSVIWNAKLPDRWVAQKEIWYDRETLRPKLVLLYDENGRVLPRAALSNYQPLNDNPSAPGRPSRTCSPTGRASSSGSCG